MPLSPPGRYLGRLRNGRIFVRTSLQPPPPRQAGQGLVGGQQALRFLTNRPCSSRPDLSHSACVRRRVSARYRPRRASVCASHVPAGNGRRCHPVYGGGHQPLFVESDTLRQSLKLPGLLGIVHCLFRAIGLPAGQQAGTLHLVSAGQDSQRCRQRSLSAAARSQVTGSRRQAVTLIGTLYAGPGPMPALDLTGSETCQVFNAIDERCARTRTLVQHQ